MGLCRKRFAQKFQPFPLAVEAEGVEAAAEEEAEGAAVVAEEAASAVLVKRRRLRRRKPRQALSQQSKLSHSQRA